MMIGQLYEMVKHDVASSIMRTGRVYAIKRTKEALRQRQKQRSGSVTSGNSREKIWILTLIEYVAMALSGEMQAYCDIEDDMVKGMFGTIVQGYLKKGYNRATAEMMAREFFRYES